MEIPQAEADILTASLRANPVFYADGQLVPYGQYSNARPGGQTQYDVNISYPARPDSQKRQARTISAHPGQEGPRGAVPGRRPPRIDNIYTAFVDVLRPRRDRPVRRGERRGAPTTCSSRRRSSFKQGEKTEGRRRTASRSSSTTPRSACGRPRRRYRRPKRALGVLLNITPEQAEALEVRGSIKDIVPAAAAGRRSWSGWRWRSAPTSSRSAWASPAPRPTSGSPGEHPPRRLRALPAVHAPGQHPQGLKSPTSWALGVTVPIPVYNRNQGVIQRAKLNVTQTQIQLATLERQAITDVRRPSRRTVTSLENVERMRGADVLPDAETVLARQQAALRVGRDRRDRLPHRPARLQRHRSGSTSTPLVPTAGACST